MVQQPYLNSDNNLQIIREKIAVNEENILPTKRKIDEESGFFTVFLDTERGSRIELHSPHGANIKEPSHENSESLFEVLNFQKIL